MKIIDVVVDNNRNIIDVIINDDNNNFNLCIPMYKLKTCTSCEFSVSYTEFGICIEERFCNSKIIESVYGINDILVMAGMGL